MKKMLSGVNAQVFLGAVGMLLLTATQANCTLAAAGQVALLQTLSNASNLIQGCAYFGTAIGGTAGAVNLMRSHGDWHGITHGALGIATVSGLALGIPSFLLMVPGVQGFVV